jgi:hypothetical protein
MPCVRDPKKTESAPDADLEAGIASKRSPHHLQFWFPPIGKLILVAAKFIPPSLDLRIVLGCLNWSPTATYKVPFSPWETAARLSTAL